MQPQYVAMISVGASLFTSLIVFGIAWGKIKANTDANTGAIKLLFMKHDENRDEISDLKVREGETSANYKHIQDDIGEIKVYIKELLQRGS